ncbi:hypothetical protein J7384_16965 [Endozoicomonas sp. G2_1]|uniref:hypothetical protein n=1 Tax=Endozoicomonas sp. G2_1 TaxID=2821091 RepID=UPI001ADAF225|nr:hypothetical protein [Endozoicomonas sp. G2_1]MBO9492055.1 hypothetical protein [Endozoicomonas sp. G2_1]
MLKDEALRIIVLLALWFSGQANACIPCDPETTLFVTSRATPKFPKSYVADTENGTVTFKLNVSATLDITKVEILELIPSDLPESSVIEMIKKSGYRLSSDKLDHIACSVENVELTFEFTIPKKVKFELDF